MTFANNLRRYRAERQWTQMQLAVAAGLHVGTIRQYEQGTREPMLYPAYRIAHALRVSIDDLTQDGRK